MALFDRVQQQQALTEYFPGTSGGSASNNSYNAQYFQDVAARAPSNFASSETTSPTSANGMAVPAHQSEQRRGTAKVVVAPPVYAAPMPQAAPESSLQARLDGDFGGSALAPSQYYPPIQEFVGRGHTVITHPHPDNPTIQEPIVERLVGMSDMNMGPAPAVPPSALAPQAYAQPAVASCGHPNMNTMGSYVPPAGQLPSVASYTPPPGGSVYAQPPAMCQHPSYTAAPCQVGFGSMGSYTPQAYNPAGMGSYAPPPMYQQPSYTPPYMGYPAPVQPMSTFRTAPAPGSTMPSYVPQANGSYIPPPHGYATPSSFTAPPMMPMMPQYPPAQFMPGYPGACPCYPPMPMPPMAPPGPQGGPASGAKPPKMPKPGPPAAAPANETFTLEGSMSSTCSAPPQTPMPPARAPQYYQHTVNLSQQRQQQQQRMPPPPQRMPAPSTISLSARSTYSEPSSCLPPAKTPGQRAPYVPPLTIPQTILPDGPWATIPPAGWQGGAAVDCY